MENTDIEAIKDFFKQVRPLSQQALVELQSKLTPKSIKRREFILEAGQVPKINSFVIKGCFKMYKTDAEGKQHNLFFASENCWITDIGSFNTRQPSELYIEALENSRVLQINKVDFDYFFEQYTAFEKTFRVILEAAYVKLQKRVLQNISSSAKERYEEFLIDYPDLANRISNAQIASYIGVTPEFLSQIRSEAIKNNS